MNVPFIDIRQQYAQNKPEIDRLVFEILETGAYVVGQHNKGLEAEIAALHQANHAIAVNSGTDALRIAMDAVGIGSGDEVITTAFTFVASVEAILQVGARPVFVDIEPHGFMIDPSLIEAAITPRTKAILPIHLFGQLAAVEAIGEIAARRGLMVLEDAAQAIGSEFRGKPAGKFGRVAGISFYVTKNLGAAGDGGMILTDEAEIAEKCRSLRVHGMGRERYYYDAVGYTSRLDEIQAAILRVKLTKLAEWTARRQQLAEIYREELAGLEGIVTPPTLQGNNHTWHQFTIRAERRDQLQPYLKERGIDSMIYYPVPIHFHEPYRNLAGGEGSLPETERAAREVLSLPVNPSLNDDQIRYVCSAIREFARTPAQV